MKNFVDDVKKIGYHLLGNQAQVVVGELAEPDARTRRKKKDYMISWVYYLPDRSFKASTRKYIRSPEILELTTQQSFT